MQQTILLTTTESTPLQLRVLDIRKTSNIKKPNNTRKLRNSSDKQRRLKLLKKKMELGIHKTRFLQ